MAAEQVAESPAPRGVATVPVPELLRPALPVQCWHLVTLSNGRRYLIGAEIAKHLKKETYNLYRSVRLRGVSICRADPDELQWLAEQGLVTRGCRTATFMDYDGFREALERHGVRGLLKKRTRESMHSRRKCGHDDDDDDVEEDDEVSCDSDLGIEIRPASPLPPAACPGEDTARPSQPDAWGLLYWASIVELSA